MFNRKLTSNATVLDLFLLLSHLHPPYFLLTTIFNGTVARDNLFSPFTVSRNRMKNWDFKIC